MRKKFTLGLVVLLSIMLASAAVLAEEKKVQPAKKSAPGNMLYVCSCPPGCQCDTVSTKPGKCKCGKKMTSMHVLKIENGEALLCTCGKGCACQLDPKDPTKCGCGKPVKRVSLKGLYVCNCGAGCTCNTISDQPGKCKCGKELKKVE